MFYGWKKGNMGQNPFKFRVVKHESKMNQNSDFCWMMMDVHPPKKWYL